MDNILNKIVEKLGQITEIKKVYKGLVKTIEQYPAVMVYIAGINDEYLSLRKIKRVYDVKIVIYQIIQDDLIDTQANIYNLGDLVLNKLNENINLDGVVDFSLLQTGETGLIQREGDLVIFNINYKLIKSLDF